MPQAVVMAVLPATTTASRRLRRLIPTTRGHIAPSLWTQTADSSCTAFGALAWSSTIPALATVSVASPELVVLACAPATLTLAPARGEGLPVAFA